MLLFVQGVDLVTACGFLPCGFGCVAGGLVVLCGLVVCDCCWLVSELLWCLGLLLRYCFYWL